MRLLLIGLVLLTSLGDLHAQTSTADPPGIAGAPTPDTELQLQSFDEVWQRIRDTHWDPQKVGATWERAREELRPKIEQTSSIKEVRLVLNDLINRLGQSHFGIIPQDTYGIMGRQKRAPGLRCRNSNPELPGQLARSADPARFPGSRGGDSPRLAN